MLKRRHNEAEGSDPTRRKDDTQASVSMINTEYALASAASSMTIAPHAGLPETASPLKGASIERPRVIGTRVTIGPEWLVEAEEELRAFLENSDQESVIVSESTIEAAVSFLVACSASAPRPELAVGRKGQIAFDWWGDDDATLTAEVYSDGHAVFSALYEKTALRGRIDPTDPAMPLNTSGIRFALGEVFGAHN
jgi:hypothetical protein